MLGAHIVLAAFQIVLDLVRIGIHGVLGGITCVQASLTAVEVAVGAVGTLVQAVHVVEVCVAHILLNDVVGRAAAAAMGQDGVVANGQTDIVGAGAADGADGAHIADVLIERHDTGDAPFLRDLKEEIRLGVAGLGQRLLDVIEHNRHRTILRNICVRLLAGQGVAVARQTGAASGFFRGILTSRFGDTGAGVTTASRSSRTASQP